MLQHAGQLQACTWNVSCLVQLPLLCGKSCMRDKHDRTQVKYSQLRNDTEHAASQQQPCLLTLFIDIVATRSDVLHADRTSSTVAVQSFPLPSRHVWYGGHATSMLTACLTAYDVLMHSRSLTVIVQCSSPIQNHPDVNYMKYIDNVLTCKSPAKLGVGPGLTSSSGICCRAARFK